MMRERGGGREDVGTQGCESLSVELTGCCEAGGLYAGVYLSGKNYIDVD